MIAFFNITVYDMIYIYKYLKKLLSVDNNLVPSVSLMVKSEKVYKCPRLYKEFLIMKSIAGVKILNETVLFSSLFIAIPKSFLAIMPYLFVGIREIYLLHPCYYCLANKHAKCIFQKKKRITYDISMYINSSQIRKIEWSTLFEFE